MSSGPRPVDLVRRLGDRLGQEGYRGFFEVDVLVDVDTDEVYLGELNPRISGASSITNVTAGAYADVPLFLFHLLEFIDVDLELDVDEINERWQEFAAVDLWSQMIIKETASGVERLDAAARTGAYVLDGSGTLVFRRAALDWHQLQNESEAFFLRIYGAGDYRWKGADLGVWSRRVGCRPARRGSRPVDHPGEAPHRLDPRPLHGYLGRAAGRSSSAGRAGGQSGKGLRVPLSEPRPFPSRGPQGLRGHRRKADSWSSASRRATPGQA